ncbi:MAG: electron transfer flavoprotein subunit beta/FixA family protein [Armatimonas sp.]
MKILVPVKRVPDPYEKVRVENGALALEDIKCVINPFDEIALEEAIRLKENGADAEIVAVSVGTSDSEEQLRSALAMGADRAVLIETEDVLEPGSTARLLKNLTEQEGANLVLMGKQAIDDDYGTTGQMLAALLDWPMATFASEVKLDAEATATVVREVDAGRETVRVSLPAVITADLRLNEPRYIALPAIMRARSKPLVRLDVDELGGVAAAQIETVELLSPPARKAGRKVGSVDELIAALKDEAKVL